MYMYTYINTCIFNPGFCMMKSRLWGIVYFGWRHIHPHPHPHPLNLIHPFVFKMNIIVCKDMYDILAKAEFMTLFTSWINILITFITVYNHYYYSSLLLPMPYCQTQVLNKCLLNKLMSRALWKSERLILWIWWV